jgi:hypothetical protein
MARPDHRSQWAHARRSSLKEDNSNASATTSSSSEEDSGVFDSILSSMCCRSSSSVSYSRSKEIVEEDDREVKNENYFWDEMRSFFLYGIRPVAYITIQESSSVDGSELTLPHVLVRMAEKHDKQNAHEVLSMIQGDNNSMVLSDSSSLSTKSRGMRRSSFVKSVRSRSFKYYKRGNKEKVGVKCEKESA